MINKNLLMGISSFSIVVACSFVSPVLADGSDKLWDQFVDPVVSLGNKGLSYVGTTVNQKIDDKIDQVANAAGKMAAEKIVNEIYKIRGVHGVTASGEYVTLVNDNSTLIRGLINKYVGIDLNNELAPNIPGGKAMTTFVLNKLENYFASNIINQQAQQLIAKSTSALVHKAVGQLKDKRLSYLSRKTNFVTSHEIDLNKTIGGHDVVDYDDLPFLSLSTLEDEQENLSEKYNDLNLNKTIGGRDVVDYYLAMIRIGISDEIRQVVNTHIDWAVDTIEDQGITLGYGIGATGAVMGLTAVNPMLGIAAGGVVYLDNNLNLGGKHLVRRAVESTRNVLDVKKTLKTFVAGQEIPFMPSFLAVTKKDRDNLHNKVEISHSEVEENWIKLDVVKDNRATYTNYINQKVDDSKKRVVDLKDNTVAKIKVATQAVTSSMSNVKQNTTSYISSKVTSWLGWGKSLITNVKLAIEEPFDVFEE